MSREMNLLKDAAVAETRGAAARRRKEDKVRTDMVGEERGIRRLLRCAESGAAVRGLRSSITAP